MIYDLPQVVLAHIYSFDSTYRVEFERVLEEIRAYRWMTWFFRLSKDEGCV